MRPLVAALGMGAIGAACAGPPPPALQPATPPAPRVARFTSVQQIAEAMTWFYRHPDAATFADIVIDLEALEPQLVGRKSGFGDLCAVFLWRCVTHHGYRIPQTASGRSVDRARLLLSDTPSEHAAWVAAIREPRLMSPPLLDVCWISYFATGDTAHLARILAAASERVPRDAISVVVATAQWSFKDNCRQHPAVLAYARRQRVMPRDDEQAGFLDECIQFAESAKPAPPIDR